MRLLLDTQYPLWWFTEPERLSIKAIEQIVSEDNQLFNIDRTIETALEHL